MVWFTFMTNNLLKDVLVHFYENYKGIDVAWYGMVTANLSHTPPKRSWKD